MKINQNTKQIFFICICTFLFNACGGGGNTTSKEIVNCATDTTTLVKKGDKITATTADTEIRIIHKEDSSKAVCVKQGQATVSQ